VGSVVVFQQTPLAMMSSPPSAVFSPPHMAELIVIADTSTVVTIGSTAFLHPYARKIMEARPITVNIFTPFFMFLLLIDSDYIM